MTITKNAATKVAAVATGFAMATSILALAPVAHAQTTTTTTTTTCSVGTFDLTVGATGAAVTCLQQGLIAGGFSIPAGATGYFGTQTRAAVAAWQTSRNIAPAAGYFGPISRAAWNLGGGTSTTTTTTVAGCAPGAKFSSTTGAACTSTTVVAGCAPGALFSSTTGQACSGGTTSSGALSGGEGSLDVNGNLGDVESDVDEGDEDVQVLGVELEAQDSDIMIERVDADITLSGTGSSQLDNYITEISLWLDGEMLATLDVDEGDEDTNNVFSFRFIGLDGVIREDDMGELYFAVSAVDNVDSGDTAKVLSIDVPANGIRAVDAAGLSETYVTAGEVTAETFGISGSTAGDLDISEGADNPESQVVLIDEDNDTEDVLVLAFDLEADNQDITIDAIPVGFVSTTDEVDGIASRVVLEMDGEVIDTVAVPSTATLTYQALFDNLDITLEDGATAEFKVFLDLNDADATTFATGTTLYATTTGSQAEWDVEDANGDSVTPDGSVSNSGDTLTFETEGIQVTYVSSSAVKSFEADAAGEQDVGTFTIVFDVMALDEDIYLDRDVTRDDLTAGGSAGNGFMWATTTDSTVGTTTGGTASISIADSSAEFSSTKYKINAGQTERLTLTVLLDASDIDGYAAVKLTAINWTTDSADTTPDEFHTSALEDVKTSNLNLSTI